MLHSIQFLPYVPAEITTWYTQMINGIHAYHTKPTNFIHIGAPQDYDLIVALEGIFGDIEFVGESISENGALSINTRGKRAWLCLEELTTYYKNYYYQTASFTLKNSDFNGLMFQGTWGMAADLFVRLRTIHDIDMLLQVPDTKPLAQFMCGLVGIIDGLSSVEIHSRSSAAEDLVKNEET